jgi:transposase
MARYYRKRGFVIACQDEATFGLIPIIERGWAKKGSRPIALFNSKHQYTNVFGSRTKRSFVFSFAKKKNQRTFVRFLDKTYRHFGRTCLFTDNAPWHHGKIVDNFLYSHKKTFRLVNFLTHSPELNPIEQCWKPARKSISNRVLYSLPSAEYHLRKVFQNPKVLPKMFEYLSN